MKITKRKLKQIIAEEHAIVYGRRGRVNKGRRRVAKTKTLMERRRRQLMAEQWASREAQLIMEFGFFKSLKNAATSGLEALGKGVNKAAELASDGYKQAKEAASSAMSTLADYADQGWSEWSQGYAKKMADEFKGEILKKLQTMLKIIATDGRKKAEDGKWAPLTTEEAKAMAINVIEGALSAAKADMIKGSDEAMNKVPEAQELEAVADSGEGQKAAAGDNSADIMDGRVIAFHGRKILDESYKKARKQKLIRESRQRRTRSKRRTRR